MANLYTLLKADEKQIRKILIKELDMNGYTPIINKDFIYAEGTVPVMLVAHYDTVPKPPKYIKNNKGVLSAKKGLGADDRAGIYGILEIIKKHHCHVLFTGGEEVGGVGAEAFADSGIRPAELNYIIQLDRRGSNDAVYYYGDNKEFEEFITSFGWETAIGSFTDICILAPHLEVSAVNLSIGYQNEHRPNETLDTAIMNANIARIPRMLDGEKYEWVEMKYLSKYGSYFGGSYYGSSYYGGHYYGFDAWMFYFKTEAGTTIARVEGDTFEEALAQFVITHPTVCFNDIMDYMTEDDYYELEGDFGYGGYGYGGFKEDKAF